jgi:hypothetical protein
MPMSSCTRGVRLSACANAERSAQKIEAYRRDTLADFPISKREVEGLTQSSLAEHVM